MRLELRIGLGLNALGLILKQLAVFPVSVTGFLCGICIGLGLFFLVVNLLPEKTYSKLLYRKWLEAR